jgi:hypothetical protein
LGGWSVDSFVQARSAPPVNLMGALTFTVGIEFFRQACPTLGTMEQQRSLPKGLQTGLPFQPLIFKDDVRLFAFQVFITANSKSQIARSMKARTTPLGRLCHPETLLELERADLCH